MASTTHQDFQGHYSRLYVAALLLALMLLAWPTSCKKDPQPNPTPETPTMDTIPSSDTTNVITPATNDTIQGDTVVPQSSVVKKLYYRGRDKVPPMDSVRWYANDPNYDSVYIVWMVPNSVRWTPCGFYAARDSIRERMNLSRKVCGGGELRTYQIVPDCDSLSFGVWGISNNVANDFARWGYNVRVMGNL